MKTLAEVVVYLMEQLTIADEPGIDWQSCGDITKGEAKGTFLLLAIDRAIQAITRPNQRFQRTRSAGR